MMYGITARWLWQRLSAFVIFLTLGACVSLSPSYPNPEPISKNELKIPKVYRVQRGDSLYAISVRFNKDYRKLAKINHLGHNYSIRAGQRLILDEPEEVRTARMQNKRVMVEGSSTEHHDKRTAVGSGLSGLVHFKKSDVKKSLDPVVSDNIHWIWPTRGVVVLRFSDLPLGNRGIDISGKRGEPVHAAAEGMVVYCGTGLVGYGRMLIIRHADRFLTVYAHNDKILVHEGDRVSAGQEVATLGSSGTDHDCLHFEIRVKGHPVDPLTLLPR